MTESTSGCAAGAQEVVDIDEYSRVTKTCHKKLQDIWKDLELSKDEQQRTLQEITNKALGVWNGAVDQAEQERSGVHQKIDQVGAEIRTIAEQLGDLSSIEDPNSSMAPLLVSPGKSLKRHFEDISGELDTWKRKREARVTEHDTVQNLINELREAMGMTAVSTMKVKNSITRANMDFLKLELERVRGEKVRRERKMESTLAKLRKLCIELGADDAELAASVHPSLRGYHQSMRGHYFGYTAPKSSSDETSNTQIALSDDIFTSLDARVEELAGMKEEREARLAEMQEVLHNMWGILAIPESDENRAFFQKMLLAPARLHTHTLEKCNEEIGRLEAEQAKAMKGMIKVKTAEIAQLCESTGLPLPKLDTLAGDDSSPGQVAEVLSKLVRTMAELTVLVERREPVIRAISEVEEGFKEAAWHQQHQQDNVLNNRGRDANRLLQRVIKAEEKKKRLPKAISKLRGMLDEWRTATGENFVMGKMDYQSEVLDIIEAELQAMAEGKAKKGGEKKKLPAGRSPAKENKAAPSRALAAMDRARNCAETLMPRSP